MARRGDIDSKSVATRIPMELFLKVQKDAFNNKQTLSSYLNDVLENKFANGGNINPQIKYVEKIVNVEKKVQDPALLEKIDKLTAENKRIPELEEKIKEIENATTKNVELAIKLTNSSNLDRIQQLEAELESYKQRDINNEHRNRVIDIQNQYNKYKEIAKKTNDKCVAEIERLKAELKKFKK